MGSADSGRHRFCDPDLGLRIAGFLAALCRYELQFAAADAVPLFRGMGRARRLAAAVGADSGSVDRSGGGVFKIVARTGRRARARGDGHRQRWVSGLHDFHQQSVRTDFADGCRRPRPESAAAGFRSDRASADAVHGLRRLRGAVRVRDRGAARSQRIAAGRSHPLAALDAPVDQCRVEFSDHRHRAGQLVGILRTGLGRLVVLGSGRKRQLHAVAGRHRTAAFAGDHRETRQLPQLDAAAGHRHIFAVAARCVPGALGRADQRAFLRRRSRARPVHPDFSRRDRRWFAAAVRTARARCRRRQTIHRRIARNAAADQQRVSDRSLRDGADRHAVSAARRRAGAWQDLGRSAVFLAVVHRIDGADRAVPAAGPADPLATRHTLPPAASAVALGGTGVGGGRDCLFSGAERPLENRCRCRRVGLDRAGHRTLRLAACAHAAQRIDAGNDRHGAGARRRRGVSGRCAAGGSADAAARDRDEARADARAGPRQFSFRRRAAPAGSQLHRQPRHGRGFSR